MPRDMAFESQPRSVRLGRRKAAEFQLYYAVTYPLFFVVALLSRALPSAQRPFYERGRSVFGDAKAAANTVLPFVFKA